ncbi:hypothetical protein VTK56DRAFT_4849 [Thermocarpiscus australiensis]
MDGREAELGDRRKGGQGLRAGGNKGESRIFTLAASRANLWERRHRPARSMPTPSRSAHSPTYRTLPGKRRQQAIDSDEEREPPATDQDEQTMVTSFTNTVVVLISYSCWEAMFNMRGMLLYSLALAPKAELSPAYSTSKGRNRLRVGELQGQARTSGYIRPRGPWHGNTKFVQSSN